MDFPFFKSRCLICWKSFEVPRARDSMNMTKIYFEKRIKTFGYYTWPTNKIVEDDVIDFLSLNQKLQIENDNSKGNAVYRLIGFIADGDWEVVLGFNRCPRCGIKLNHISNAPSLTNEVDELRFDNFLGLDRIHHQEELFKKTINGR